VGVRFGPSIGSEPPSATPADETDLGGNGCRVSVKQATRGVYCCWLCETRAGLSVTQLEGGDVAAIQIQTEGWLCVLPVLAYLFGSVPFSYLLPKLLKGVDIRRVGSGNVGATNAARALGFKFFPLLLLLDLSKGVLPTLAARLLVPAGGYDPPALVIGTALCAILGHAFPIYLGFRGGKAVATSTGAFLVLAPVPVLIAGAVWGVVFLLWRYVSVASICAAAVMPASVWLVHTDPLGMGRYLVGLSILGGLLVIALHRDNIRRLLAGTEHRIGRPKDPSAPGRAG